jgi:hypothetical protein
MWLEMRINFTLGLLQTKHLTIGDLWTVSHTVISDSCFDRICMSPSPDRRRECYGLCPLCSGQLYPTEEAKVATQMSYLGSHGIL